MNGKKGGKNEENKSRKENKTGKREEQEKHRGNYFHNGVAHNVRSGTPARNKSARYV